LRGEAIEKLELEPGDTLRVRGTITYVHVPAPEGYDLSTPAIRGEGLRTVIRRNAVALPATFCYLDVSEVEVLKSPEGEAEK
jgi:hypothetical protein